MDIESSYQNWFIERSFERHELLQKVTEKYDIQSILYPGSYTHITPSFYIPHAAYVDSDPTAKKIFKDMDEIIKFVAKHKIYDDAPKIEFFGQSYSTPLPTKDKFDMLFSQYAGPISQDCKKYLKKKGILVVNNSHADAGLAFLDADYELIAVSKGAGISEHKLDDYFIPKKKEVTMQELLDSGTGIGYTKVASNYIFRKIV